MDTSDRYRDAMLPGDEVVSVRPAEWSDRARRGRVTRRWRACADTIIVEWEAARPGERVRVDVPGAVLPRGTTGRVVAINAEGWVAVAPDRTIDTIAHVRRADLGHL